MDMIYTDCFSFFPRKILSDLNISRATTKKVQYSLSLISDKVFFFLSPRISLSGDVCTPMKGDFWSVVWLFCIKYIKSQLIQTGDRELLSRVFTAYKNLVTTNPGVFVVNTIQVLWISSWILVTEALMHFLKIHLCNVQFCATLGNRSYVQTNPGYDHSHRVEPILSRTNQVGVQTRIALRKL